jgi:hypothetical protein
MSWNFLLENAGPCLRVTGGSADDLCDAVLALEDLRARGLVTRWLRGSRMRTKQGLLDEFAAVLQFPSGMGMNWDSFDECLNDLEWLEGEAAALFIFDAEQLLADASPDDQATLFEILDAEGDVPVHFVLQSEAADTLLAGLQAMGVAAARLES